MAVPQLSAPQALPTWSFQDAWHLGDLLCLVWLVQSLSHSSLHPSPVLLGPACAAASQWGPAREKAAQPSGVWFWRKGPALSSAWTHTSVLCALGLVCPRGFLFSFMGTGQHGSEGPTGPWKRLGLHRFASRCHAIRIDGDDFMGRVRVPCSSLTVGHRHHNLVLEHGRHPEKSPCALCGASLPPSRTTALCSVTTSGCVVLFGPFLLL